MKKFLCTLIAITVIISGFLCGCTKTEYDKSAESWMTSLDGSKKLGQYNIPATHDSAANITTFLSFSTCQSLTIDEQLKAGIRFFDIRLEYDGDGTFHCVHADADCYKKPFKKLTLDDVLDSYYNFLSNNKGETILILIKEDDGDAKEEFYTNFYENYVLKNENKWYTKNEVPTLDEVRGKIVLLRRTSIDTSKFDNSNSGINFNNWDDQGDKSTTESKIMELKSFDDSSSYGNVLIQDRYSLKPKDKFFKSATYVFENENTNDFNLNYLSTAGLLIPKLASNKINKDFKNYDFSSSKCKQIVFFDDVTPALAKQVYQNN